MNIVEFKNSNWPAVWQIIEPVFRAGETYAFPEDISEEEARTAWIKKPRATFVTVEENGEVCGTYYIKTNQPGPGSHVCNCGYIVSEKARGRGIASLMCEHSQQHALALGYRTMQFNLVVSSNEGAIRLWEKLGFDIVGRLPGAFRHPQLEFIDAFIMYKLLKFAS
ncbi:MAG: GNAT family N-acetyltransferase [Calditrichaeota bacterium]|nr:MAG: GNAT family N-acetyltransferase [Calditrichota bacterium]